MGTAYQSIVTMKSSFRRMEKTPDSKGDLPRALFLSLLLHAFVIEALLPAVSRMPRSQPPVSVLVGVLLPEFHAEPPPLPEKRMLPQSATTAVPPSKPVLQKPILAQTAEAGQSADPQRTADERQPIAVATAGGEIVPQSVPAQTTSSLAVEPVASGPDAAALRQYRLALASEARRFRRYPESARRQGFTGTVEVRVAVDPILSVRRADLNRSSGHAQLDAAALEMLQQAVAHARLPEALSGQHFAVLMPVIFEVED